jgi:hypothetical protein
MEDQVVLTQDELIELYAKEIKRLGGLTQIDEYDDTVHLKVIDSDGADYLLGLDGWQYYGEVLGSQRHTFAYLCTAESCGLCAVRVSKRLTSVKEAKKWVVPAAIRDVEYEKHWYVYVVKKAQDRTQSSAKYLPDGYIWDPETRMLHYRTSMYVRYPAKFVPQKSQWHIMYTSMAKAAAKK